MMTGGFASDHKSYEVGRNELDYFDDPRKLFVAVAGVADSCSGCKGCHVNTVKVNKISPGNSVYS